MVAPDERGRAGCLAMASVEAAASKIPAKKACFMLIRVLSPVLSCKRAEAPWAAGPPVTEALTIAASRPVCGGPGLWRACGDGCRSPATFARNGGAGRRGPG